MTIASSEEAPLGSLPEIDRVEWLSVSAREVMVALSGAWHDPPPAAEPVLVVADGGGPRTFDASEQPVARAGHGSALGAGGALRDADAWTAAFVVPIELRPRLESGLRLRVGESEMALPAAVTGTAAGLEPARVAGQVIDRAVLAERRARRAEMTEQTLARRAGDAEDQARNLEGQMGNLEQRLGEADIERDRLERELAERERQLRATRQREYAEQQLRIEAEEERRASERELRKEIEVLRRRLAVAERQRAELGRELEALRRQVAEVHQEVRAAQTGATGAERAIAEREALVLQAEIDLEERMASVQDAQIEVSALRDELDSRRGGLCARLDVLNRELERGREAAEHERELREQAERALAAERSRGREEQRDDRARVQDLERDVAERVRVQGMVTGELAGLRGELVRLRAESEEEARRHDAAETMLENLHRAASSLRLELSQSETARRRAEDSSRELRRVGEAHEQEALRLRGEAEEASMALAQARAQADMGVRALAEAEHTVVNVRREASALQEQLDSERRQRYRSEQELRDRLVSEREAFREQTVVAESELRSALLEQRRHFESQVARVQSTVADLRKGLQTAVGELEQRAAVEAEQQRAREAEQTVARAGVLDDLRCELERVRAETEARASRESELEDAVAQLSATAASVREAYEDELGRLQGDLGAQVAAERDSYGRELADVERRVAQLRRELEGAARELGSQVEVERRARLVAETELAGQRQQAEAQRARAGELEQALHQRALAEARARAELRDAQTDLERRLQTETQVPAETSEIGPQQERLGPDAGVGEGPVAQSAELVRDLGLAVERLRERVPAASDGEDEPGGDAGPGAAELAGGGPPETDPEPAREPVAATAFVPRTLPDRGPRTRTRWLTEAIVRLAHTGDPTRAAALIVALLPAQALFVRWSTTYALEIEEVGSFRVSLDRGEATVSPLSGSDDVDFVIAGPARELASLAGGGASRRLPGVRISGRRRRARKLLRALRSPLGTVELARSGLDVAPELLLAALGQAVDPAWTVGHRFTVAYRLLGATQQTVHVQVGDGNALIIGPAPAGAAAMVTMSVTPTALAALLSGSPAASEPVPEVAGNANALALLMEWFDRAQGHQVAGA